MLQVCQVSLQLTIQLSRLLVCTPAAKCDDMAAPPTPPDMRFEELTALGCLKNLVTCEPHRVAHNGRWLACHRESETMFGAHGELLQAVFGETESDWVLKHAIVECMHPAAFALTASHALMKCFGGARMRGNRANPTPAGVFMTGLNTESVGTSRQTDYARKLRTTLATKTKQKAEVCGQVSDVEVARRLREEQPPRAGPDAVAESDKAERKDYGMFGQAFTGKGVGNRCCGKEDSHMYLLDEIMTWSHSSA